MHQRIRPDVQRIRAATEGWHPDVPGRLSRHLFQPGDVHEGRHAHVRRPARSSGRFDQAVARWCGPRNARIPMRCYCWSGGVCTRTRCGGAGSRTKRQSLVGCLFAFGSATLTPAARATLDKLTSQQGDPHFTRVAVTGHTDAIGSDTSNLQLSQQRADAVAGYLRERGLRADTFVVTGRGKADPVASNATAEGRAGNRRVEIVLQR